MSSGERLSLLGFGAMRLPTTQRGGVEDIDESAAVQLIDYALEQGVNYFDTAWPYHDGQSEPFLGRVLVDRHPRESFYLATKLPIWEVNSPEQADEVFAQQLAKLRTGYIDFYLMHALDGARLDHILERGLLQWAIDLQHAGAIRRLGFSFHGTMAELERILSASDWDFGMLQINYLDWSLQNAKQAHQMLRDANIPVMVMEPMRGGKLATLTLAAAEILTDVHPDRSVASWGFRFAAALPDVVTVLSGMTTLEQLKDNIATFSLAESDLSLSKHEEKVLALALETSNLVAAIPCTDCKYCMPCPYDVDIAGVFGAYNMYKAGGSAFGYKNSLKVMGDDALADACIGCGECISRCPQTIDIPAEMEAIAAETVPLLSVDEYLAQRAERIAARSREDEK